MLLKISIHFHPLITITDSKSNVLIVETLDFKGNPTKKEKQTMMIIMVAANQLFLLMMSKIIVTTTTDSDNFATQHNSRIFILLLIQTE